MKNTIITSIITTLTVLAALQWPLITIFGLWIGFGIFSSLYMYYEEAHLNKGESVLWLFIMALILAPMATYFALSEGGPKDFKWLPKFQSPIVLSKKHE